VRAMALSQSLPTPNTQELLRVVTSVAAGAPGLAFPLAVAPIAPEPLVPEVSIPVKLTTVMEAAALCDKFAVTLTLERVPGAKARQISAVPSCALVRLTKAQVRPAPVTLVTVMPLDVPSLEINASSNSLPALVENDGEVMLAAELDLSVDLIWSMAIALHAGIAGVQISNKAKTRLIEIPK
jgi:hypothetical protein